MGSLAILLAVTVVSAPPVAAKSPITHETLWGMKRVSSPAASPDGKWVVVSVVEPSYDDKEQISDLWIAPTDGSAAPRRLTATKGGESGTAWSPDSRRIAFTARREGDEVSQVYIIEIGGGEAVRITSLSTGASSPRFSPDGQSILFQSRVYPGAADDEANKKIAAERKARKYNARVYESFPIRNWDHWLDDRKAHVFVQAAEPGAKARDLLAGTALAAERGFGGSTTSSGDNLSPVWTPDGRGIVFAASTKKDTAAYASVHYSLYMVPEGGGEPKRITPEGLSYSGPQFRPDGKALYAIAEKHSGKSYSLERLAKFSWPEVGAPVVVTSSFDRSVSAYAFTPDSRALYLVAEDAGLAKLYTMPAEGGPARPLGGASTGCYGDLEISGTEDAPVFTAMWGSAVHPAEAVRLDPRGGAHRRLTSFTVAAAEEIDWLPLRHFTFTSGKGRQVHNLVALPPRFDESKKYPLLVLIHGGPHSMWRDEITLRWNYHLLAAPGYVVLMTNYTGSTGFGEQFAQNIHLDPLRTPGEELNEAAAEAVKRFAFIDGARQCAGGASYGGHLANWLEATTSHYKCLISHAGLVNLESQWGTSDMIYHRELGAGGPPWEQGPVWREQNPIRYAKNFRTPILLTIGEKDYRVPLNQTLENWSALQRMRVPGKLIVFPDANHWILKPEDSRFFYKEVHAWLGQYLGE